MRLRIVKYGDNNFGVERKGLFFWTVTHSTPGYPTEEAAKQGMIRYAQPEVIGYYEIPSKV